MQFQGKYYRTVWMESNKCCFIEQNLLPFSFQISHTDQYKEICRAISTMQIRGAGAIGAAAGYALALAFLHAPASNFWEYIDKAVQEIEATRPTARNLFYATGRIYRAARSAAEPVQAAVREARQIADEDAAASRLIGKTGNKLIQDKFNILTHCNAGWLAFVDYGTALSPIYQAHADSKKIHVYVDETGPRRQGARLTAWELANAGISHTIIPDNAAAFLMSQDLIDIIIVGADRIAANGDTANKIGTLERAIVASVYDVPFYVAAPFSTFDPFCTQGSEITIEYRDEAEVLYAEGINAQGRRDTLLIANPGSKALNPAFDITPAHLIKAFITDRGIIKPEPAAIKKMLGNNLCNIRA